MPTHITWYCGNRPYQVITVSFYFMHYTVHLEQDGIGYKSPRSLDQQKHGRPFQVQDYDGEKVHLQT